MVLRDERIQNILLLDVVPLGIGIEDANGHMCTIIPRNCTIPTRKTSHFTNVYAFQTNATIRVFEGEHKLTTYNVSAVIFTRIVIVTRSFG